MKGELHIIPDLCNEEAIYYVFIGDEYIALYTSFKNYVAYATSHRAMLKRKKVKELGWVEK